LSKLNTLPPNHPRRVGIGVYPAVCGTSLHQSTKIHKKSTPEWRSWWTNFISI